MSGGLAQVAILLSTLMGGVSGSAVADAAMEARILGPAMIAKGYGKGFSAAAIAVGSLITATIPPSIGLILYGYVGNVSIGRLFLAGIIPGLLMMVVLMATTYVIAKRRGYVVADSTQADLQALSRVPPGKRNGRCSFRSRCCSRSAAGCSRRRKSAPSPWSTRSPSASSPIAS